MKLSFPKVNFSFGPLPIIIEFLPIMLFSLLFIVDSNIEKHIVKYSLQIGITIISITLFFLLLLKTNSKTLAFIFAAVVWIGLAFLKYKIVKNMA